MKNRTYLRLFVLALTVLMLLPVTVAAAKYPKHENYVADEADILSESVINMIRDTNRDLAADYGLTIAVCTVETVGSTEIATYAQELYKEWKLGEGVLILIAKDDKNYYFVPSVGMQDILTNEDFTSVRDNYFEADFNNGSYENAIYKSVPKFKNLMVAGMQNKLAEEKKAAEEEAKNNENEEEKGTTVGSVIVGFFKFILWLVIIGVILVIALFVGALFNDDLAVIFRKYILRKNDDIRPNPTDFYDERLYGGRSNPNNIQRNRPQGQGPSAAQRRPNTNGYPQNGNYPNNPYGYAGNQTRGYLGDGRGGYPNQNYNPNTGYTYNNPQRYPQNNGQYGNRPTNGNYTGGQGYPQNRPMNGNGNNPNYSRPMNGNVGGNYNNYNGNYNPNRNNNNRPGYGNPQNGNGNNDATVQFNIPRRN